MNLEGNCLSISEGTPTQQGEQQGQEQEYCRNGTEELEHTLMEENSDLPHC